MRPLHSSPPPLHPQKKQKNIANILSADIQSTVANAILILVSGQISIAGAALRTFTQMFCVAQKAAADGGGFFVRNSVFRFVEGIAPAAGAATTASVAAQGAANDKKDASVTEAAEAQAAASSLLAQISPSEEKGDDALGGGWAADATTAGDAEADAKAAAEKKSVDVAKAAAKKKEKDEKAVAREKEREKKSASKKAQKAAADAAEAKAAADAAEKKKNAKPLSFAQVRAESLSLSFACSVRRAACGVRCDVLLSDLFRGVK